MKDLNTQKGYVDTQLPPVIIGAIMIVGLTNFVSNPENALKSPAIVHYLLSGVAFVLIFFGFYTNMESLKCPESPFNKHTSPLFLGLLASGSLLYSIWKLHNTPYKALLIVFWVALVSICVAAAVLQFTRK